MRSRTPSPASVGAAAVTVLSAGLAAAFTLLSTPVATPAPAGRIVAAYEQAATPLSLSFPAPPAPVEIAPPAPAPAAAAPAQPADPAPRAAAAPPADPRCSGADWQSRRGEAAVERLRRPADARAVPVSFRPARSDVLGLAHLDARRVELFVRSCARQSDGLLLHVLAHELGHVLDVTHMTSELRAQWMAARGIPASTPWFGCDGCTDFATPAGDFAETYAQWQRGATGNRSELAAGPSRAQLAELAQRFFRPL